MKKTRRTLLCLLLVTLMIVSFAVPTMALSTTMTYKSNNGTYSDSIGSYSYSYKTGASLSKVTGEMSYGRYIDLGCMLDVKIEYSTAIYHKDVDNAMRATKLTVSGDNSITLSENGTSVTRYGSILSVTGTYTFGTLFSKLHTIS